MKITTECKCGATASFEDEGVEILPGGCFHAITNEAKVLAEAWEKRHESCRNPFRSFFITEEEPIPWLQAKPPAKDNTENQTKIEINSPNITKNLEDIWIEIVEGMTKNYVLETITDVYSGFNDFSDEPPEEDTENQAHPGGKNADIPNGVILWNGIYEILRGYQLGNFNNFESSTDDILLTSSLKVAFDHIMKHIEKTIEI